MRLLSRFLTHSTTPLTFTFATSTKIVRTTLRATSRTPFQSSIRLNTCTRYFLPAPKSSFTNDLQSPRMKCDKIDRLEAERDLRNTYRKDSAKEVLASGLTLSERKVAWTEKKASYEQARLQMKSTSPKKMTSGTEIRKVLISAYGDESNVAVVTATLPDPAKGEVQVKVLYSGFSGSDINMRRGIYPLQKSAPLTPGYCCVGPVVANGPGSKKFKTGDMVCCLSVYDSEATLANLPEKYVYPVPAGVPLKAVPALLLDWNTGYGMVEHTAHVKAGQRVFIHGISGAVGWSMAVLSSLRGAEVYGTASPKNHDAVRKGLPGAMPFDYGNKDWMKAMKDLGGAHVVFDPLAFESWDESYSILAPKNSMLVGYGGNMSNFTGEAPKSMIPQVSKLYARNYLKIWDGRATRFYYITRDDSTFLSSLEHLFKLVQDKKVEVPIKAIYEMKTTEDIREAHRSWGKGQGVGSLLVRVGADED